LRFGLSAGALKLGFGHLPLSVEQLDLLLALPGALLKLAGLAAEVVDLRLTQAQPIVELVERLLQLAKAAFFVGQQQPARFQLGLARLKARLGGLLLVGSAPDGVAQHALLGLKSKPPERSAPQLDLFQLSLVLTIALRLLRLAPQRAELFFDFGDHVG